MKQLIRPALRIICYVMLPLGSYLASGAIGIHALTNILKPIIPKTMPQEIAVIVLLIVFPSVIILLWRPQTNVQTVTSKPAVSKTFLGVIENPSLRQLIKDLIPIIALIIIGLLPAIFWIAFLMIIFSAVG